MTVKSHYKLKNRYYVFWIFVVPVLLISLDLVEYVSRPNTQDKKHLLYSRDKNYMKRPPLSWDAVKSLKQARKVIANVIKVVHQN